MRHDGKIVTMFRCIENVQAPLHPAVASAIRCDGIRVASCSNRARTHRALFAVVVSCPLLLGCGKGQPKVHGTVTLDGTPVAAGLITFEACDGTVGPSAGATIKNGEYSIAGKTGPRPGKYRVLIEGYRKTGKLLPNPMNPEIKIEESVPILPPQYASGEALKRDVVAGDNTLDFALNSRGTVN